VGSIDLGENSKKSVSRTRKWEFIVTVPARIYFWQTLKTLVAAEKSMKQHQLNAAELMKYPQSAS